MLPFINFCLWERVEPEVRYNEVTLVHEWV